MSSFQQNRFNGSTNTFSNDGTYNMYVATMQVKSLAPNQYVATDSTSTLISVPKPEQISAFASLYIPKNPETPNINNNAGGIIEVFFNEIKAEHNINIDVDLHHLRIVQPGYYSISCMFSGIAIWEPFSGATPYINGTLDILVNYASLASTEWVAFIQPEIYGIINPTVQVIVPLSEGDVISMGIGTYGTITPCNAQIYTASIDATYIGDANSKFLSDIEQTIQNLTSVIFNPNQPYQKRLNDIESVIYSLSNNTIFKGTINQQITDIQTYLYNLTDTTRYDIGLIVITLENLTGIIIDTNQSVEAQLADIETLIYNLSNITISSFGSIKSQIQFINQFLANYIA